MIYQKILILPHMLGHPAPGSPISVFPLAKVCLCLRPTSVRPIIKPFLMAIKNDLQGKSASDTVHKYICTFGLIAENNHIFSTAEPSGRGVAERPLTSRSTLTWFCYHKMPQTPPPSPSPHVCVYLCGKFRHIKWNLIPAVISRTSQDSSWTGQSTTHPEQGIGRRSPG